MLPQPGLTIAVLMMTGVVVATLGISALVFHGIEAPLRDWTRRRVAARFGPVSRGGRQDNG
jgi:peptidoglycan/LPS O-acetylase OafA/YrhL